MSPAPEGASQWKEYRNPEGRVYWSHVVTKQSVWEKPDELRTPFEKALQRTDWKVYTSKDRPYYVNSITRETKWDLPPELGALKKRVAAREQYEDEKRRRKALGQATPTPPPGLRSPTPDSPRAGDHNALQRWSAPEEKEPPRSLPTGPKADSSKPQKPMETIYMPPGGFRDYGEAEHAFIHLLRKEGVDETWTWDQTMRRIIMDPLYRALETLAQKRAAFEKYTSGLVEERRKAKEDRITRLRPIFFKMFEKHPAIKPYSTMKTAQAVFARDANWQEAELDERHMILEEWTTEKRSAAEETERTIRQRNLNKLSALIRRLDIDITTRWRGAYEAILSSSPWKSDPELQTIETIDMLDIYDEYNRELEKDFDVDSRRQRIDRVRFARKARDDFRAMLHELQTEGKLTRLSKWKDLYPAIREDPRYKALLGMQGSSPIDLFMDIVDDLAEETERTVEKVERAIGPGKFTLDTTLSQLEDMIDDTTLRGVLDTKIVADSFAMMHGKLAQAAADEARRAERRRRHRIDDLRYALKKVARHIDLEMRYEEALPFMKDLPEFKDVTDEEDRKAAFDKFVARQKEKLREAEGSARVEKSDKPREKDQDRRESMHMDRDERKDRDRQRDKEDRLSERGSEREYHARDRPSRDQYDERDQARRESGASEKDRTARKEEWKDRYAAKDNRSEKYDKYDRHDKYEREQSDRRRDSRRDKGLDYGDSSHDRKDRDRHEDLSREKDQHKSSRRERKHATDFMDDDREPKRAKKDDDVEEGEI